MKIKNAAPKQVGTAELYLIKLFIKQIALHGFIPIDNR